MPGNTTNPFIIGTSPNPDLAGSVHFGLNDSGTGSKSDTPLTQLRSLAVHLGRQYQQLPATAQPHASNIIQQARNIRDAADYERLRPWIAESARRFAAALHS
jgi:hypothetical protein